MLILHALLHAAHFVLDVAGVMALIFIAAFVVAIRTADAERKP